MNQNIALKCVLFIPGRGSSVSRPWVDALRQANRGEANKIRPAFIWALVPKLIEKLIFNA